MYVYDTLMHCTCTLNDCHSDFDYLNVDYPGPGIIEIVGSAIDFMHVIRLLPAT